MASSFYTQLSVECRVLLQLVDLLVSFKNSRQINIFITVFTKACN
jgi:hypothetical protein